MVVVAAAERWWEKEEDAGGDRTRAQRKDPVRQHGNRSPSFPNPRARSSSIIVSVTDHSETR